MAEKELSHRASSYEPKELLWQSKKQIFQVSGGRPKSELIILANSLFQQTEIMAHPG